MSLLKLPTIEELKQMKEEDKKRKEEEKKREEEAIKQVEIELSNKFNELLNKKIKNNHSSLLKGDKLIMEIYRSYFSKIYDTYHTYDTNNHYYNYAKHLINELNKEGIYEIIISDIINYGKIFEGFRITIRLKL